MRGCTEMKLVLGVGALLFSGLFENVTAGAQVAQVLPVVKLVMPCEALGTTSLRNAVGVDVKLQASTVDTSKGHFCHVAGLIDPAVHPEVDLPVEHWTQRLLQAGCGGLCGMVNASIGFPHIAHQTGTSTKDAADFKAAPSNVVRPATQSWIGADLLAPKAPTTYVVRDGKLAQQ